METHDTNQPTRVQLTSSLRETEIVILFATQLLHSSLVFDFITLISNLKIRKCIAFPPRRHPVFAATVFFMSY